MARKGCLEAGLSRKTDIAWVAAAFGARQPHGMVEIGVGRLTETWLRNKNFLRDKKLVSFCRRGRTCLALGMLLLSAACAPLMDPHTQQSVLGPLALDTRDQLEETNRAQFARNKTFNDLITSPAARTYRAVVPQAVRERIDTGANNLDEPRIFANNLLQGRLDAANKTFGRFLMNTTFGFAGMFDVASLAGIERQTGDFGQTLFVWGVGSGPYVVLPVLGPATVRDGFGRVVDIAGDPVSWVLPIWTGQAPFAGVTAASGLSQIELLDDFQQGSIDPYVRFRSTYLQNRAGELGQAAGIHVTPELVETPASVEAEPAPLKKKAGKKH